jgi:hypothetical protein
MLHMTTSYPFSLHRFWINNLDRLHLVHLR